MRGYNRNNRLRNVNRTYCVIKLEYYLVTPHNLKMMSRTLNFPLFLCFFSTLYSFRVFSVPHTQFWSLLPSFSFLFVFDFLLCLPIHLNRSQSADSGNMCMMNWAGTPAAQVLPRVHGDTTKGELLCSTVTCDTLLLYMHTWNSLHHRQGINSPTSASNTIIQECIHNTRTLQDKYWSYSRKINALTHICRIEFARMG